jgi:hypothetical protein
LVGGDEQMARAAPDLAVLVKEAIVKGLCLGLA